MASEAPCRFASNYTIDNKRRQVQQMGAGTSKPELKPEFKDFHANTVEEAVKKLASYLEDTRVLNQAIYFYGWGGLGASAVLNSIAEHPPPSVRNKFQNIIHIDCSRWRNRRAVQRMVAHKLRLPQRVMAIFDTQNEDDDLAGVDECSRVEVLWTFQGRLRATDARNKIQGTEAVGTSYLYLGSIFSKKSSDLSHRVEILREEAAEIAQYTNKLMVTREIAEVCCRYLLSLNSNATTSLDFNWVTHASNYWVCDGILQEFQREEAWEVATALHEELRLEGLSSYRKTYSFDDTASWIVVTEGIVPTVQPETTSFFLAIKEKDDRSVVSLPKDMFQISEQLHVLKLCHCTFSFSSPPFLCCRNIRFLGVDSCKDEPHDKPEEYKEQEEEGNVSPTIGEFFQSLWVLDVCRTDWELIVSPNTIEMVATNIREINIKSGRIWHNNLSWTCLGNIHKLRVVDPTRPWETGNEDEFKDMVKLELLDLSENSTIKLLPSLSGAIGLKTLILDDCIGLQHVVPETLPPTLETFSLDVGYQEAKISCISLAGCARLVNFRLHGSVMNLEELDLSNTSIKKLDLTDEVVQVPCLQRIILLGCEQLGAVLWPKHGMPKLMVLGIDTRGGPEAVNSKTLHDSFVNKEREEGCHAFIAVSDMRFIQSLVLTSADKFCWNTDPRYDLNICLYSTSKDVGQNYNNVKMGPLQKCSVNYDSNSVWQFHPLDRHVEIETFWAADLLTARCIWSKGRTINIKDTESFAKLQAIRLHSCPKLTFVLPLSWFNTLSSLETLHIVCCGDLSHVFPVEAEFLNKIGTGHPRGVLEFPKLQHIYFHDLPKLHQICEARMYAPELKTITVRGCCSLKHLPGTTDRPYDRPVVDCEKVWWEKLEWDGREASHHPSLFDPRH
ncbi:unnamed protein product [Miscanthus lutarioriparius]|uniref:Disease resistance protein At4g27190-like leucine-rich repeats domain-containing protein n=1 Tax=Miscanthus lutarioriparius TaxID=422564 RepID=A0A811MY41_9POAL|nr:unnamed protein product [Miscanthus lutarioriparius]